MNYYSVQDLQNETTDILEQVRKTGEAVITNNGKPSVLIVKILEDNVDELLEAITRGRAMVAFKGMQKISVDNGFADMSEEEVAKIIEEEIQTARLEQGKIIIPAIMCKTNAEFLTENNEFDDEILKDLENQGLKGDKLLDAFRIYREKVRPAVKNMLEDAEKIATGEAKFYTFDEVF